MKIEVGDKILLKEELKNGRSYRDILFIDRMAEEQYYTIKYIVEELPNCFYVEENRYIYSIDMIKAKINDPIQKISHDYSHDFSVREDLIREFLTGSKRNADEGKPRMGLLPLDLLKRVSYLYTSGAEKFGDDNWRKGQPKDATMDSLMRHVTAYRNGDTDEDHLSAIVWNALSMMHVDEHLLEDHPELDFKYKYERK